MNLPSRYRDKVSAENFQTTKEDFFMDLSPEYISELAKVFARTTEEHHTNLKTILWKRASEEAADFAAGYLSDALVFETAIQLRSYAIQKSINNFESNIHALYLECGVFSGRRAAGAAQED